MISHLRGTVFSKEAPIVALDVHGVGYEVLVTIPTYSALPEPGSEAFLHIHTHVREDQFSLFGFAHLDEKRLFEKLIAVSGIGPKLAISVLSGMPAAQLVVALRNNDLGRLTKVPGIGKKTAERMVLELRDKLATFPTAAEELPARLPVNEDVLSALLNLGYPRPAAERATAHAAQLHPEADFEHLFRASLADLTR